MMGKRFLWICLLSVVLTSALTEHVKQDAKRARNKEHQKDSVWSHGRSRQLFARRKSSPNQVAKLQPPQKLQPVPPARRCGGVMETCSPLTSCCDPCSSCRCRLFNTICHCWKISSRCPKKT